MSIRIYWTQLAQHDLRSIRDHIARDAPATASAYIRRIQKSVTRLKEMPYSGQVVPELGREETRRISQRIVFRSSGFTLFCDQQNHEGSG